MLYNALMKKVFYISAVASILAFGTAGISYAQNITDQIQAKIDAIQQERDSVQAAAMQQKQQMESEFAPQMQNSGKTFSRNQNASSTNFFKNINQKIEYNLESRISKQLDDQRNKLAEGFENAIKNLNNLIQRISSRMDKMQAAGADVSSSKILFNKAEANIETSTNNLTDLEAMLAESTSTSTRSAILSRIKIQNDKTKASVETSYKSIMDLINLLKQESLSIESASSNSATTSAVSATSSDESQNQSTSTTDEATTSEE